MARGFQIHPADNVATMLDDTQPGAVEVIGARSHSLATTTAVKLGHKIALAALKPRDAIVKFGVRIGHATRGIQPGEWVHLHNLASDLDERSGTLDSDSGAPTDTTYE